MGRYWDQVQEYLVAYIADASQGKSLAAKADFPKPELLQASPIYPLIYELLNSKPNSQSKRSPIISIFLGGDEEDFPFQVIAHKTQELCNLYAQLGRTVQLYVGNWFNPDFCQERAIATLFNILNTESVIVIDTGYANPYQNLEQQSLNLCSGYWREHWETCLLKSFSIDLQTLAQSWQEFRDNWLEIIPSFVEIYIALQLDQHFLELGISPLLPELLHGYFGTGAPSLELEKSLIHHFQTIYQSLSHSIQYSLSLDFALSLSHFQDKSYLQSYVIEFMETWLKLANIELSEFTVNTEITTKIKDLAQLIQSAFKLEEWHYIKKLNACFNVISIDCQLSVMNLIYNEEFEFTVLKINAQGQVRRSRSHRTKFFKYALEPNIDLEMVYIPGGIFRMGSPRTETGHESSESPMHWVAVTPFFMGKFPITQAQWRAIAALPPVNKKLEPDPSCFKGDNHPVENVSWYDAVEFCDRLAIKTGIQYRLPTEAEWEYACRSGTKHPFCFGETISSEIANYDGSYAYGFGATGAYREQTIDVGSFDAANSYGLYDMHGQVLEWCADPWHENYQNAPTDGKAWQESEQNLERVLRGGSWFNVAGRCRAASRHRYGADIWLNHVGFRVAVSL
ncbi:hypothetical protein Syn7502_00884 [Synechococcus sp. PCC 7502]|uniref:formylglycine-generating enzyme family protein n=1 Tax=Synechococcus sp. PCC 7502 TaxID=1173263 RepID=UPI00029FA423|nr:formylglycine-generating enzyme family protein [Synechococcus sp. PCC 7502]AFY73007.1 hypothetical protein Syn7502_00884 [Synechococcus sp. PCC 7502]